MWRQSHGYNERGYGLQAATSVLLYPGYMVTFKNKILNPNFF